MFVRFYEKFGGVEICKKGKERLRIRQVGDERIYFMVRNFN